MWRGVVGALLCMLLAGDVTADPVSHGKSFVDTFSGLDTERWFVSHGWSNGDHQGCTWSNENVRVADGRLTLSLSDRPSKGRRFSCAELHSREFYGYGTYEVRMRTAAASGVVTAFFTYVGPSTKKDSPHDEIDFEFLGKDRRGVQVNYFVDGKKEFNGRANGETVVFDFDTTTEMSEYAFEWTPQALRWFANGKLVYERRGEPGYPLPSHPSKIYLSVWSGQGEDSKWWLGPFEYSGRPIVASIERVAYTAAGEPCQFPESIVCKRQGKGLPEKQ
jgi:endo-1,3-1,4-beta-glycanase ExoK